ncbi:hypothetical protein ADIAL_1323 [Alkalibacterium sp. AK22]|nr:hypothetical protein ADIAL_1323 [Alkalibacterium sp. AK22]
MLTQLSFLIIRQESEQPPKKAAPEFRCLEHKDSFKVRLSIETCCFNVLQKQPFTEV